MSIHLPYRRMPFPFRAVICPHLFGEGLLDFVGDGVLGIANPTKFFSFLSAVNPYKISLSVC